MPQNPSVPTSVPEHVVEHEPTSSEAKHSVHRTWLFHACPCFSPVQLVALAGFGMVAFYSPTECFHVLSPLISLHVRKLGMSAYCDQYYYIGTCATSMHRLEYFVTILIQSGTYS